MQIHRILFSLTLAFLIAANCFAQDEAKKGGKGKKGDDRAVTTMTKQMMTAFKAANLTDEQKEKAAALIKKHAPDVMAARKAQDSLLTADQKKARVDAMKKAKEEGLKGPKAEAAAMKAMGLNDEEVKKYNEAKKKVTAATGKIKEAIAGLLTDEQKAAMPKGKGKKGGGKKKKKDGDDNN